LLTFSFDFVAPDSFPADGEIQIDRGNFNNFNQFDRLQLDTDPNDGTGDIVTTSFTESDAYNALEKNRLDIVINVTGSGVSYQSKTVAHDTYDVWLNGNLIIDGAAGQGTGDTKAISGLRFRAAGNGRMFYDNVEVRDEAFVIPEPASLALLGLGGLMTLGRSRRAGRA